MQSEIYQIFDRYKNQPPLNLPQEFWSFFTPLERLQARYSLVVAIDGPSGTGKSSLCRKLSSDWNLLYIDTGAMFRTLALLFDEVFQIQAEKYLTFEIAKQKELIQQIDPIWKIENQKICIQVVNHQMIKCWKEVDEQIRTPKVSQAASMISQNSLIRQYLLQKQRDLVKDNMCLMEGRDITTVVFPNAFIKIYLTADSHLRAMRRLHQLEMNATPENIQIMLEQVEERDDRDMNRKEAPLVCSPEAIYIDNSRWTQDETLSYVKKIIWDKFVTQVNDARVRGI
jgi:cytidylate kinase